MRTETGLGVLHLFCKPSRVVDREALAAAIKDVEAAEGQVVTAAMLGHKCDLALMALHADWSVLRTWPHDPAIPDRGLAFSPGYLFFDMLSRVFSPYQLNPFNYNPLQPILEQVVDFENLRRRCAIRLFLCATNVRTGKVRVFTNDEICAAHVLASACLPLLHQAVAIDGECFWDGGYMGNPALFPLIYECKSRDIVIIHINPTERPDLPRTAPEIMNRINEISFNSSLLRELRAIAFVTRLIDDGKIADGSLKRMLIHEIEADDVMQRLGPASKLDADWAFLTRLHDIGRARADSWLEACLDMIGVESTVDVRTKYL